MSDAPLAAAAGIPMIQTLHHFPTGHPPLGPLHEESPHGISILTKLKAISGKGRKCSWARWQASAGAGLEGEETTLSAKRWWICQGTLHEGDSI